LSEGSRWLWAVFIGSWRQGDCPDPADGVPLTRVPARVKLAALVRRVLAGSRSQGLFLLVIEADNKTARTSSGGYAFRKTDSDLGGKERNRRLHLGQRRGHDTVIGRSSGVLHRFQHTKWLHIRAQDMFRSSNRRINNDIRGTINRVVRAPEVWTQDFPGRPNPPAVPCLTAGRIRSNLATMQ
jgi:hypothetical protein